MTESSTPANQEPADQGGPPENFEQRPDEKEVRGNPPVDEDAVEKGRDSLERVKPH
jgi:hypothetical protein